MAGEMAERIGARIRERRTELGMKQRELAEKLGSDAIDNQRISDWERGVNRPSDRYMEALAVALDRDVSWFFREDVNPTTPDLSLVKPASTESDLAEVLAAITSQLVAQTEVLQEVRGALVEVKGVLVEVKDLLGKDTATAARIEAATQRVDEASRKLLARGVGEAGSKLRADTPRRKPKATKRVPKRTPKASPQDPPVDQ